jgi:DNA polymerase delta subunit 2
MHDNLMQRHLCSTAPDTLACHPFVDEDPFILRSCPHVYFVGNQSSFSVEAVQGQIGQKVTTVSVPAFARTGTIALINLATLECRPMTFDAALS